MNTLKWLFALVGLLLGLVAPSRAMASGHRCLQLVLLADCVQQAGKAPARTAPAAPAVASAEPRDVNGLLVRARQAIKEGDLDTADKLIAQAEKSHVRYGVLHFGDTPKKARAAWAAAKRGGKQQSLARPSQKFAPQLPGAADEPPAPAEGPGGSLTTTAEVPQEIRGPLDAQPLALPQSEGRIPELQAPQRQALSPDDVDLPTRLAGPPAETAATPEVAAPTGHSNPHLLAARQALAVGDLRRASAAIEAAKGLKQNYALHDDTPEKVEAAVRDYRQVMEQLNTQGDSEAVRHQLATLLLDQAQHLMRWKQFDEADRLAQSVKSLQVTYGPFEVKPDAIVEKIAAARRQHDAAAGEGEGSKVAPEPQDSQPPSSVAGGPRRPAAYPTRQAVFEPQQDDTSNRTASAMQESPPDEEVEPSVPQAAEVLPEGVAEPRPVASEGSSARELFEAGEQALREQDKPKALELFKQAHEARNQLDPTTAQRLQDHLHMLSSPAKGAEKKDESTLDEATQKQRLLAKQISADVAQKQVKAGKIKEKEPAEAMKLLKEARASVEGATLDPQDRAVLLGRVDRSIQDLDKYISQNKHQIELDAKNKAVLDEVERRQKAKIEVDEKLAKLVNEYNKLMDEERWPEAEVLAKRARELDPENPLVRQLMWNSRFAIRYQRNQDLQDDKESAAWNTFQSVEDSAVPFDDRNPIVMPDPKKWKDLTDSRTKQLAEGRRRTERELEIERKLQTPVSLKFRDAPLHEVLNHLAKLAAVNLHLDEKGLEEEGVSSDTPVNIDLTQDITLKSALNLILEPKHLSYVIKDEVLKVTSEQLRDGEIYPVTYNVADLVIPIPNFVPNGRTGMAGAIGDAYNTNWGGMGGMGGGMGYVASQDGTQATGVLDSKILAQVNNLMPGANSARGGTPGQFGPGGMGGGAQPDFDSLIDLIVTTVKPQTWDEVGGPGSISQFPNNLSLVISQTQDVHEDIADLLEQLRKNQDLQVTIEVRFITLNDNFFEQIGVDFQANIVNTADVNPRGEQPINAVVGLLPPAPGAGFPNFTSNLDLPFRQESFNLATPQFGQPVNVANFGFAILSDLEAYLLVNASQGDRRSNVLQAPKVTMFNGQTASVIDVSLTPFVISVIPVVGDFAAAYQPVITVLSEGTALSVQAVISSDRRFVRLTVIPLFSQIGDVQEFTFSGSSSSSASTASESSSGSSGDSTADSEDEATTTEGITLQLPNFSIVSVTTTVSVPDGGTVLLGGIKRLSEGRNEFGVPILSKLPYINRLFKNVGIGRETQSLMMMVTPRIIIQEEEEERLGIQATP